MKQFFKFMFASMLGFILSFVIVCILFVIIIAGIASAGDKEVKVNDNSILHINLTEKITDRASKNPFENFDFSSLSSEKQLGLNQVLESLEKAETDDKIKGIYLDLSNVDAGIATIEEIRNKLMNFKKSGKFILAYSEMYDQSSYYLATVADKIYVQPEGGMEWKGLSAQVMFFKKALEKLEIEPQIIRHGQFKSAIEPLILDKMSEPNRKQTMSYLSSIWNHILSGVSKERKVSVEELNSLAGTMAIQTPEDAIKYKLIDKAMYKDEILSELKLKVSIPESEKLSLISLSNYSDAPWIDRPSGSNKIAVIYASGAIQSGKGDDNTIGSDHISKAIREARLDDKVKAIVLRVNSPGGSALASDVIWREIVLAKKVKPVIASMGDVAASGGYYIACAANKIIASPNTITGSIGVFGVLFNSQKLMNEKLGITIDTVKTNPYADLGSVFRPLSSAERNVIQKSVEDVYTDFITKVAEGRKKTVAQIDSIGQGRVWSGVDALNIGLIDELGGLDHAIIAAAKLAKLDKYRVTSLPAQKEFFDQLITEFSSDIEGRIIRNELGENYKYYKNLQTVLKQEGIQARMPFEIEVY